MKKFVNEELEAPNVLRVPIDLQATQVLLPFATSSAGQRRLFCRSPEWRSDIRWLSPKSRGDFERFREVFDRLGIARHVASYVEYQSQIRLYNSMLIIRSDCREPDFHVDWFDNNNDGFTMMAPLSACNEGFGLLYKKVDGTIGEYGYKLGEALIFGDDFVHSTKPGTSSRPLVFLCFNFGTDKMEYWPRIERTAARQTMLTCRPDGKFHRIPLLRRIRLLVGSGLRRAGLKRTRRVRSLV